MKKRYKTIGVVTLLVAFSIFVLYSYYFKNGHEDLNGNQVENMYIEDNGNEKQVTTNEKQIVVEIKGEVNKPNVYWMKEDSIVEDLINLAGGIKEGADINKLNRAEKLKNHQCVTIPNKNDLKGGDVLSSQADISRQDLVNINTASESELDKLPGIGKTKAKEIVSYREKNGEFKSIEDLKNVKGIAGSLFEKLKDKITV